MVEDANLGSDQFAIALTNVAPSASNTVLTDITQIAYTGVSSRNLTTTSSSQAAGVYSLVFANLTIGTATTTPTFRYVVIYDDTLSGDPLVGWYDIGATTIPANTSLIFSGMGLDLNGTFDPESLFTGGYVGGWYDPSDLSTLWQDSARTTPVTADGDPVGCIDDKSGNGFHLTQATSGKRPLYRTSGGLHWLVNDGIDDVLFGSASSNEFLAPWEFWAATNFTAGAGIFDGVFSKNDSDASGISSTSIQGIFQRSDGVQRTMASGSRIGGGSVDSSSLLTAFAIGTAFTSRAQAKLSANELIITANGNSTTAAAAYTGTAANNKFRIFQASATATIKFYGGLAINRALTSGESTSLKAYLDAKAGL
jgi:hypothetical protein